MPYSFEGNPLPTISVVIPTWNRAGTIEAAVRSALAQTVSPLEVLVCDDGSTDDSEARVRAIGDPRICWLPGTRGGRPAIPRNRGIAAARGEWLAFLDSDDVWLPEKLERQIAMAKILGVRAVCCDAWRVKPNGGDIATRLLGGGDRVLAWGDLLRANRVICSSAVIHRSALVGSDGFPEEPELKALEDYALWLRVAVRTNFAYLSRPMLNYLDDAENSVRTGKPDGWSQRLAVLRNFGYWSETRRLPVRMRLRLCCGILYAQARHGLRMPG